VPAISGLGAAGTLTGAELVPVVQSGTTVRTTAQLIANLASGGTAGVFVNGRLTLVSGDPVPAADQTAKTTIYFTPYKGNLLTLWDGAAWVTAAFTEKSLALGTLTAALPYDVFCYLSTGTPALELLAWSSGSARATAVTLQDGRYCKSGDKTRLYLGTFYTTSTTTTEDSGGGTSSQVGGKRFVWNYYNRVVRELNVIDTTNSWTYATATVRQANAASGNKVEMVLGIREDTVGAIVHGQMLSSSGTAWGVVGVGVDSTTTISGPHGAGFNGTGTNSGVCLTGSWQGSLAPGYHSLSWLEAGSGGVSIFVGDDGGVSPSQTGLSAVVQG